jgi:hypothetical protein
MKIDFTVASVDIVGKGVIAKVDGQDIPAVIDSLEVQLISDTHGSLRLRFTGTEKDAASKLFKVGSKHTWTL